MTALALGTMLGVYGTIIPLEEAYLRKKFGLAFDEYAERVPRLVPRLRPAEPQSGRYDAGVIAKAETRTFATFGAMVATLFFKARRGSL